MSRATTKCPHIFVEHRFRTKPSSPAFRFPNDKRYILCTLMLRHKHCSFDWAALQILYRKFVADETMKTQTRMIYAYIYVSKPQGVPIVYAEHTFYWYFSCCFFELYIFFMNSNWIARQKKMRTSLGMLPIWILKNCITINYYSRMRFIVFFLVWHLFPRV